MYQGLWFGVKNRLPGFANKIHLKNTHTQTHILETVIIQSLMYFLRSVSSPSSLSRVKTTWRPNLNFLNCTKKRQQNITYQVLQYNSITAFLAFTLGCDIPLSKAEKGVKFDASSYQVGKEPYRARLGTSKAWCAKKDVVYTQYLLVNLSSVRHVSAIELQGAKWSFREFYVKKFLISYSIDGKKFKFYKTRSKTGESSLLVNYIYYYYYYASMYISLKPCYWLPLENIAMLPLGCDCFQTFPNQNKVFVKCRCSFSKNRLFIFYMSPFQGTVACWNLRRLS